MTDEDLDELIGELDGEDSRAALEKLLAYWRGCHNAARSAAFLAKVRRLVQDEYLPRTRRTGLIFLLGEMTGAESSFFEEPTT